METIIEKYGLTELPGKSMIGRTGDLPQQNFHSRWSTIQGAGHKKGSIKIRMIKTSEKHHSYHL